MTIAEHLRGDRIAMVPNPHYKCSECGKDLWSKHRRRMNPNACPMAYKVEDKLLCSKCFYELEGDDTND